MLPREIEAKYEVRGTLGSGAMGTVYDAMDRLIERRVAIKVVKRPPPGDPEGEEAHARFRREAQAAGRLNHPNIVAVYDYGENAENAWIVMELVEGGSLKQRLDRQERFTVPEIVRLMDQMLAALAYSHARGVVHRDIKPGNVMLTAEGTVKLADFGIARLENSSMTQVGTVIGTPSYMAPEQLRGEPVDARADIWAAGVVLYQLLTGEKPFDGGFSAVMHKALHTEPPPPSQLSVTAPRAFDAVVAKALAKRPEDRFPTAAAFAEAVRAAAAAPAGVAAGAEAVPGFAGAGPLPGLDGDATMVSGASSPPRTVASPPPGPQPPRPAAPAAPAGAAGKRTPIGGKRTPTGLILGAGGGLAAAAVAAWLLLGQGSGPTPSDDSATARQEQIRREAEQRAREEAERLQRQAAEEQQQREAAARQEAERQLAQRQEAEQRQLAQRQEAERQLAQRQAAAQQAAAEAEAERRRQTEAQQAAAAAAAEAERRRQAEAQQAAAAAAEAERRRQAEEQAAAEKRRQAEEQAAAEKRRQAEEQATAEKRRQAEEQAAAERRRQQEQEALLRARAELRTAAAAAANAEPCSLIAWSTADDRATLTGVVRRGGEAVIRQTLAARGVPPEAVTLRLQSFEGPYCEALETIRPIVATSAEAPPRARVLGASPLARGELLRLSVEMPDYPAQLYVSYLMKSGEVAHLVPSRPEGARAQVALGDPAPGFPGWEVDEPFGTDMIIVFASERPIFAQRRPVVEKQSDYLAALGARLRALQGQGVRISARVLLVDTVPQR